MVPRCMRFDVGTENVLMIKMQKALRSIHVDDWTGEKSVKLGKSVYNQRIGENPVLSFFSNRHCV